MRTEGILSLQEQKKGSNFHALHITSDGDSVKFAVIFIIVAVELICHFLSLFSSKACNLQKCHNAFCLQSESISVSQHLNQPAFISESRQTTFLLLQMKANGNFMVSESCYKKLLTTSECWLYIINGYIWLSPSSESEVDRCEYSQSRVEKVNRSEVVILIHATQK